MTGAKKWVIEPLNTHHDRPGFRCGDNTLDTYLRQQAKQDVKRRVSRVFIARDRDTPTTVLAYYTLSTLSIELNHLPQALARRLPRHPIPAALIGRLAVSLLVQGQGLGGLLLADAIKRVLGVSDDIAIYALVVDALNADAERFYRQFGFLPLNTNHLNQRLFLPLTRLPLAD